MAHRLCHTTTREVWVRPELVLNTVWNKNRETAYW